MSSSTIPVTCIAAQIMCVPQSQASLLLSAVRRAALALFFAAHAVCSSSPILRRRSARHRVEHARAHGLSRRGRGRARAAEVISHIRRHILPNEVNEIPFFDVELPYELALKIFQFLNKADLGRCAQVSKSWRVLAEDEVLWYRLFLEEGYHRGASVSDSPCWKSTLRDCINTEKNVKYNWKNRVGSISHLQYELGKVLCDVSSCERLVIAGYTSGDVRLWDTLHWDSGALNLQPAHSTRAETPLPHVSLVRVTDTVACAAYENGCVDVWSTESGVEPIHHYQHLQRVCALDLCADAPVVTSASGSEVRVDTPDDRGYWRTVCLTQLAKPVDGVMVVPGKRESPLVSAWAGESVYLLDPSEREEESDEEEGARVLHSVYGHPVTCLDVSACRAAVGVKSCGWGMNDGGNKVRVYSLETGQAELVLGNSAGDFTCISLGDAPLHLLVCGNKDRRVRVFDLRSGSSVVSLYAHHMGVTTVQADDWKIVSGGGEGLVCVWEMRMGAKLWEMHNRHPVRHIRFNSSTLVTANIPDEKNPRGACITDDDLTAHRRHRGVICYYDFSMDSSSQEHVLPICRSDYTETSGYNYNIGLAMPYDTLADPQGSGL
ncbi:F-box/WD repeat-containing protein 8 isoform X2 [Pangasianodon hypophthalmus]|uniref:F-box/WD repeat-containing protein 8 isoform X2 n=1 Tax=Pangasianodon hypophthalmus TaxID=310915 RepID=UPI00230703C2|nr:F-box/WD repeat-containing protein 8 isoform X2 [Pangasianodon hypophthalmus]